MVKAWERREVILIKHWGILSKSESWGQVKSVVLLLGESVTKAFKLYMLILVRCSISTQFQLIILVSLLRREMFLGSFPMPISPVVIAVVEIHFNSGWSKGATSLVSVVAHKEGKRTYCLLGHV